MSQSLKTGERLVNQHGEKTLAEWEDLLKKKALSTRQVYLYCLWEYYKSKGVEKPEFSKRSMELREVRDQAMKEQKTSEKQKENWLSWEDVLRVREKVKEQADVNYIKNLNYLAVCLYTMMPPLRLDWASAMIHDAETPVPAAGNVLDIRGKTFHLRDYKTAKAHGPQALQVPEALMTIIQASLKKFPRKALLGAVRSLDTPITQSCLSHHLRSIFKAHSGRAVSVHILRRSWVSHEMKGQPSLTEQEKRAKAMGHTWAIHQLYRNL